MYFALETRSYAQTIFLVTLSSYLLVRMMHIGTERGWRKALVSNTAILFMGANVALLLTHYYNFFFWAAQGAIVGIFVLREWRPRRWLAGLTIAVALYGLQGAIFVLVWGQAFARGVRRRSGDFAVEGGVRSPFELLESIVRPNIDPPIVLAVAGVAVAIVLLVRALVALANGTGLTADRQRAWMVLYLGGWLLLPLIVAFVAFEIAGVARYSSRYWLFIAPALAGLVVLGIREVVNLAGRTLKGALGVGTHPAWPAAITLVMITTLVLPGTLAAATASKSDWRGIVQQVVDLVDEDDESTYIIYETGWSSNPRSTYYFERFSEEVKPYATLRQSDEDRGELPILTVDEPVIADHDYLIVLFPHLTTSNFPDALSQLEQRYEIQHQQLNPSGRGFIVFDVHPDQS